MRCDAHLRAGQAEQNAVLDLGRPFKRGDEFEHEGRVAEPITDKTDQA
jgi:hypothetical protein